MRWIGLLALVGCAGATDNTDEGGDDTAAVAAVQAAFIGYTYWTPDILPGQGEAWCVETYPVVDTGMVTCTQKVRLVSNGNVMWTHYVTYPDGTMDTVDVVPYASWTEVGPYEMLFGGFKYQVDGMTWTVWPDQATNWDEPETPRIVLAGGRMMNFTPAPTR